jgi:hypothetical protein
VALPGRPASVLILTVGDETSPGTRLRPLAYRSYLERRGHRVRIVFPLGADPNRLRRRRLLRPFELVRDLRAASKADIVVVYRKTFPGPTARWLRRLAPRLIYEFDDAVDLPSPDEPQDERSRARYRSNFRATVAAADLVVAGNRHLAERAGHPRTEVVPTGVDLSIFRPKEGTGRRDECVVGWIGTRGNLPEWSSLSPVFERVVAARPGVRLKVVSDGDPPATPFPVEVERFTIEREAACLEDVEIGLMPLADTPWNRGKCSYKALQCMAMGLPVVLSPVGMNREVVEHGVSGLFAASEEEWVGAILGLAADRELRARIGRAARAVVERSYSLDRVGAAMVEIIDRLLGRTGGAGPAPAGDRPRLS